MAIEIGQTAPAFDLQDPAGEHVKLADDKVLIPGVVSHCITLVEHPELVAQRIARFASVVGRERVIASNDCGFATSAAGDEPHPDVAWAKIEALGGKVTGSVSGGVTVELAVPVGAA